MHCTKNLKNFLTPGEIPLETSQRILLENIPCSCSEMPPGMFWDTPSGILLDKCPGITSKMLLELRYKSSWYSLRFFQRLIQRVLQRIYLDVVFKLPQAFCSFCRNSSSTLGTSSGISPNVFREYLHSIPQTFFTGRHSWMLSWRDSWKSS